MLKQIYRWFCYIGLHRYEKIDINFSFGPGGSTETVKCKDCGSDDLHWLAWVDKDNKYIGESAYSENGEYWCNKCEENKE